MMVSDPHAAFEIVLVYIAIPILHIVLNKYHL